MTNEEPIVAHTLEEGGVWQKGPPQVEYWHTIVYLSGLAFDKTLVRLGINDGEKRPQPPTGCASWADFEQLTDAEWRRRVAEVENKYRRER